MDRLLSWVCEAYGEGWNGKLVVRYGKLPSFQKQISMFLNLPTASRQLLATEIELLGGVKFGFCSIEILRKILELRGLIIPDTSWDASVGRARLLLAVSVPPPATPADSDQTDGTASTAVCPSATPALDQTDGTASTAVSPSATTALVQTEGIASAPCKRRRRAAPIRLPEHSLTSAMKALREVRHFTPCFAYRLTLL